jgi:acyl-CoA hydrolase
MKPLQDISAEFRPGMRVLLHAGPAESTALQAHLSTCPERMEGVTFCGLFIPGLSRFDYAALTQTSRIETVFANPAMRASLVAHQLDLLPIHYSAYPGFLERNPVDLAVLHLPPAREGRFSCGIAADVAEAAKRYARRVIVLANEAIPFTPGGVAATVEDVAAVYDAPCALNLFPSEAGDAAAGVIATRVAALVRDGDCVQIGIGKVPAAILRALTGHRNLRFFGGMIVDEVADLAAAGALAPGQSIITGTAIGSRRLHDFAREGRAAFHGVAKTHDMLELARQAHFISINSAIEVDLFGAINCENIKGRPISGVGGGTDYMRAARLMPGGRSVIALGAEAKGISRIVPRLEAGTTSVARADIDFLVTEFGMARLRDLPLDKRAEAIISLAAPEHRAPLAEQWRTLRMAM